MQNFQNLNLENSTYKHTHLVGGLPTHASHFDCASVDRVRIPQGEVARVLLLFKQYGQNVMCTFRHSAALVFMRDKQAMKTIGLPKEYPRAGGRHPRRAGGDAAAGCVNDRRL